MWVNKEHSMSRTKVCLVEAKPDMRMPLGKTMQPLRFTSLIEITRIWEIDFLYLIFPDDSTI